MEGHGPHYYTLAEVSACTGNWDEANVLGQGGYGKVYLGKGPDGVQWAVKRVQGRVSEQALTDFKNEVSARRTVLQSFE